jgi:predicted dehydrogenase
LVEKPLTTTTSEAELILKALRGTYVKLTLNYNALLNETMMKALRLVENSAAGQVLGVEVRMLHTKDDQMASDEKHWCHKMPGGRFGEMLAHPIYLLQSMLGNNLEVEKILTDKRGNHSWMRHDELYVLLHSNNGIGQIHVSFNSPRPAFLVDVYGTEKILKIDLMNQTLLALGHRTLSKKDSAMDTLGVSRELFSQTMRNSWRYLLRQRGHDALERAYASLVGSIEEDRPLLVTPEMAYHTVRIEEGICKQIG